MPKPKNLTRETKEYWIMDARASYNEDEAMVMEVCETREEAEANKHLYGNDCVVVEKETGNAH